MGDYFSNILVAAEAGNSDAQFSLAIGYDKGEGVKMNSQKAVQWYQKSAEIGHANAQYNLAQCYQNGLGVAIDSVGIKSVVQQ